MSPNDSGSLAGRTHEVRRSLSETAKYQVAVLLLERNVSATRAARAMGISATVFGRYVRRYNNPWILQHVKEDHLTLSDADDYLDAAGKANAIESLKQSLSSTCTKAADHIVRLQERAAVTKTKLPAKQLLAKTYLQKAKVKKQILESLKQGKPIAISLDLDESAAAETTSEPGAATGTSTNGVKDFYFECAINEKDGKLKVSGLNGVTLNQLSHETLAAIAYKLDTVVKEVLALHKTKRAAVSTLEATKQASLPHMIAFYEGIGEQGLADKLRAQIAPTGGNGQKHGNGQKIRTETPITDGINVPPNVSE
jgi:predicted transcriptional regulator